VCPFLLNIFQEEKSRAIRELVNHPRRNLLDAFICFVRLIRHHFISAPFTLTDSMLVTKRNRKAVEQKFSGKFAACDLNDTQHYD
jgi:hypothetical protein